MNRRAFIRKAGVIGVGAQRLADRITAAKAVNMFFFSKVSVNGTPG